MDVTSLSSSDFYREFGHSIDVVSKISGQDYFDDDDSTHKYRAWLIVAYCALLTIGVIGNVWVAAVIGCVLRASGHRFGVLGAQTVEAPKAIQIYILSLCCSDLIVLAFLLFLVADLIHGHWILPSSTALCRLYLCTESLNKFCGPFLLVALSGYCYVSVCRRHRKNNRYLTTVSSSSICAVVISVCLALVILLVTPVYIYGDVQFLIVHNANDIYSITPKCALQPPENILTIFTIYSFLCGYVTPAFLFTFFYASILACAYRQVKTRVRKKSLTLMPPPQYLDSINQRATRRVRRSYLSRVVKTSMGLVLFYLLCWSPYWILCLHQYLTPHQSMNESNAGVLFGYIIHMLPYINCTGYPILYTVLNKTIKDAYKRQLTIRRGSSCSPRLLCDKTRNGKNVCNISKPPSCLIELSVAISTSYASNPQLVPGRPTKDLL